MLAMEKRMMEITSMPAAQLADLIEKRIVGAEAVKAQLDAISLREPVYKAL